MCCLSPTMPLWIFEIIFWSAFLFLNGLNFIINYILYLNTSHFIPYLGDVKKLGKVGLVSTRNLDPFRYVCEISFILLTSRYLNLAPYHFSITISYVVLLLFNQYQYILRRIYQQEPILQSDLRLLQNGISIIWKESPLKVMLGFLLMTLMVFGIDMGIKYLLTFSAAFGPTSFSHVATASWVIIVMYSIYSIKGLTKKYPSDLYLRYHFTLVELLLNLKRSYQNFQLSKEKLGMRYHDKRKGIAIELTSSPPNIFIIFIESYGSFYFESPELKNKSISSFEQFSTQLNQQGYHVSSNYSASTTTGGQSWLTFSSVLYGYRMHNNTLYENHLNDPNFRQGNSLLKVLRNAGYTNYHLNPINPIEGINVPYEELKEFYQVDKWVLADDINYQGQPYGFGSCPPDQYSMNYMMNLIRKENSSPFTYFYLTKSSHSPFMSPDWVKDWKTLNQKGEKQIIEEGFLQRPQLQDYQKAIQYEYDVLGDFISNHPNEKDIFLLMGDHQPPIISDPETYGFYTPVHLITKDQSFSMEFAQYGFVKEIAAAQEGSLTHESIYSMFLKAFSKHYTISAKNIPDYEPKGVHL